MEKYFSLFSPLHYSLKQFQYSPSYDEDLAIHLTEIMHPTDSRWSLPAMKTEVDDLLRRKTYKLILKEDLRLDENVCPGCFVLARKSTEDNKVKFKNRSLIGGHRDKMFII